MIYLFAVYLNHAKSARPAVALRQFAPSFPQSLKIRRFTARTEIFHLPKTQKSRPDTRRDGLYRTLNWFNERCRQTCLGLYYPSRLVPGHFRHYQIRCCPFASLWRLLAGMASSQHHRRSRAHLFEDYAR